MRRFGPNDISFFNCKVLAQLIVASHMIIDILFFHCSFVDMLNIISTCRDILCVDINVDKLCVDHSTIRYTARFHCCISIMLHLHTGCSHFMLHLFCTTFLFNQELIISHLHIILFQAMHLINGINFHIISEIQIEFSIFKRHEFPSF